MLKPNPKVPCVDLLGLNYIVCDGISGDWSKHDNLPVIWSISTIYISGLTQFGGFLPLTTPIKPLKPFGMWLE